MSKRVKLQVNSYKGRRLPRWLKTLLVLILLGALVFGALEGVVLFGGRTQIAGAPNEPEIMVILGCQMKPWGPSTLLQDRLDTALDYLEDHPDMTVIVSGAQGTDEHVSEARGMYDYLTAHGVDGDHIYLEERSFNTWQNIGYTQELLRELFASGEVEPSENIVVVSNGFHLARVRMLWGRVWEGDYTLSTLAAPASHVPSRIKMFFREPLALVKSFVLDR